MTVVRIFTAPARESVTKILESNSTARPMTLPKEHVFAIPESDVHDLTAASSRLVISEMLSVEGEKSLT